MSSADLKKSLQAQTWHAAGIDPEIAERLAREHRLLRAGAQPASEVIDLVERERLMRGIAAFYGRVHAVAPDELLWAGFAAIAVNDGVLPTTELTRAVAELVRRAAPLSPRLAAQLGGLVEDGLKCAFETNYAIFADLGWVHLAYLDGGIETIRRLHGDGELDAAIRDGFEEIERGARERGSAGDARILRGNLRLFRHEQHASVTPVFARYAEAMAFASRLGLVGVPNRKLAARAESLGRSPAWDDGKISYGPFAARWRWLVRHAWEPLVALDRDRRARGCRELEGEVARAVEGRREDGLISLAVGVAAAAAQLLS